MAYSNESRVTSREKVGATDGFQPTAEEKFAVPQ